MSRFVAKMHERLVRNSTSDSDQGCWRWTGRKDRFGYALINLYVPLLVGNATLKAHIVSYILVHGAEWIDGADDLYCAYKFLTGSGLQLDHECVCSSCINPEHLTPVEHITNQQLRDARRKARTQIALNYHA